MQVNTSDQHQKTNPGFLLKHSASCYPHCPHRLCKARGHCKSLIWGHEIMVCGYWSVAQSCPTLWPHGLQNTRPPCPSPTLRACSNSCPLSQWFHPTISSSVTPSPPGLSLSQHQGLFQWVRSSHQVAKKHWSFKFRISPSSEYSGLICFRIDWFDLLRSWKLESNNRRLCARSWVKSKFCSAKDRDPVLSFFSCNDL